MSALFSEKIAKNIFKTPLLRNIFLVYLAIAILLPVYGIIFEVPLFNKIVIESAEDNAKNIALYLEPVIFPISNKLEGNYFSNKDVIGKIENIVSSFQLEKIQMFSKSGEIVYSSDPGEVGKINRKAYFREIVAKGIISSQMVKKDTKSVENLAVTSDVVKTYIPIMSNGSFRGAFKIYYDISSKKEKLNNLLLHSIYILSVMALIVLIAVVLYLFNTSKINLERSQQEEALRESEEKFQTIAFFAQDAITIMDDKGNISYANAAAEKIFNYPDRKMIGMDFNELIASGQNHEIFGKGFEAFQKELIEEASGKLVELNALRKNGAEIPIELSLAAVKVKGRWNTIGIVRETTERRMALRALRESEERYRSLFENSRDAIMIWTPEDKIVGANQSALKTFGYTIEEMIGLDLSQIYSNPEDQSRFKEELNQKGVVRGFEVKLRRKDSSVMDILLTSTVRIDKKRSILGYQGFLRDVTSQKMNEKKLRNTLDTLRKAMGAHIQAMSLMVESRDSYTAGHQRRVSDLARTIAMELGLSADRIDGIRFSAKIHDLGKMGIPAEILTKPGQLSKIEFEIIKDHTQIGYDILKGIEFPWPVAKTILEHHEKMDGSGYPKGLSGQEISLEAKILCVADVVEAMASHRPYRPSLGIEKALEEISVKRGTLFDSNVVDACIKIFRDKKYQLN